MVTEILDFDIVTTAYLWRAENSVAWKMHTAGQEVGSFPTGIVIVAAISSNNPLPQP